MRLRTVHILPALALVVLLAVSLPAFAQDSWEQEFSVQSGQKIELEMKYGGSLVVEGWDQDQVRISCSDEMNPISDYVIEASETRGGVSFSATLKDNHNKSNGMEVKLMVPREFDIETRSAGGGISISNVTGEFTGKTAGGSIKLHNLSGTAHLTSGGGLIEILDSDLDGKVTTGGGGGVVRNVNGDIKVTSGGGFISYENVRDNYGEARGPSGISAKGIFPGSIMRSTAGGSINLDEAPDGAKVRTGGGNINIRNASHFVEATTGGGDIAIEIMNGYVVAKTGAGDIEVTVDGDLGDSADGINLMTGHGDVIVTLPADASIELDLDLSYTRNSSRSYELDCEFDVEIERTDTWETRHGSPRKHIYGKATINGGEHRVVIHNVNGNITIRKR